jgi:hypothetical protein
MKNQKQTKGAVGHTPGPWKVTDDSEIGRPDRLFISFNDGEFDFDLAEINSEHADDARANARLIAAAPEMLQCLYKLREQLEVIIGDNTALIAMVNRTIAMAEGRGE